MPPQQPNASPSGEPAPVTRAQMAINPLAGAEVSPLEATWTVEDDSPLPQALPFLPWQQSSTSTSISIPRASLVGALIMTCHTPIDDDALDEFDEMSFLTHELTVEKATEIAEKLDAVGAFESLYRTYDEWVESIPHLQGRFDYDGLDDLFLEPSSFIETETRTTGDLEFLKAISLGCFFRRLHPIDPGLWSPSLLPLAEAITLMGYKATRAAREKSNGLRNSAARMQILCKRAMQTQSATPFAILNSTESTPTHTRS
jgi:hypothetical protein